MSDRLRSRADLEAWLDRGGREWFVQEPTLRLPVALSPAGERAMVDVAWRGPQGVELFVALGVSVKDARARAVDVALCGANADCPIGGFRRSGPGVVFAVTVFPDHQEQLAVTIFERALAACTDAVSRHGRAIAGAAR